MKRAVPIVFAMLALSTFGGCKRTLHWKAIEDALAANIDEHVPGAHTRVSCPETLVERGIKFRCHATTSVGREGDIEVELEDTAGSWASHPVP